VKPVSKPQGGVGDGAFEGIGTANPVLTPNQAEG